MSLEPEFFEERQRRCDVWETKGYFELNTLEELLGISESDITSIGLLEPSPSLSTIDLREVTVAEMGKPIFKIVDYQLIFVKPPKILPLLKMLEEAGMLRSDGRQTEVKTN